jgi:hypothetical protein
MTLERQHFGNRDQPYSRRLLRRLMSEVISLREQVAQAELEQGHYRVPLEDRGKASDRQGWAAKSSSSTADA